MQRSFAKLEMVQDVGEVIHLTAEMIAEQGVIRMSYHLTPAFEKATSIGTSVYTRGFSDEWMKLYEDHWRDRDPIPLRVLAAGRMMTWSEAMTAGENDTEVEAYFELMREHGLEHGFGVPLFGLDGCDAYSSFDFGKPIADVGDDRVGLVRALAQIGHQRVCVLSRSEQTKIDLSDREREVLEWLARGKSIWVIAEILDLSPDTVKTYSKRIHAKLEVSDRVGAVVKALKLGIIKV